MEPNGFLYVEVVAGVEGPSLNISDEEGSGLRIAGPKAWGGGKTIHRFQVSAEELIKEAGLYLIKEDTDE